MKLIKNHSEKLTPFFATLLGGVLLNCSTHPPLPVSENSSLSSLRIHYSVGYQTYQVVITADAEQVSGKKLRNQRVIEEGPIEHAKYSIFLTKIMEWAQNQPNRSEHDKNCPSPVTVWFREKSSEKTYYSCRTQETSELNDLIRDAEFLLYSKI